MVGCCSPQGWEGQPKIDWMAGVLPQSHEGKQKAGTKAVCPFKGPKGQQNVKRLVFYYPQGKKGHQ